MLVGVAPLPYSFPPSRTLAFYFINRPPWANILVPSVSLKGLVLFQDKKFKTTFHHHF